MRKNLVIVAMISLHLVGNTEVGQLFKLPELINHYFQHHRIDTSLNFFEFIAEHYAGDDGTTADDDFDSKLPCHNATHNTISFVYSPMVKEIPSIDLSYRETQVYSSNLPIGISSKHVALILQPPRTA